VDGIPSNLSVRAVERFVGERFDESVGLDEEKYERIEFRGREFDVAAEHGSDRYYHGYARGDDVLVVIHEDSTELVEYAVGYC